MQRIKISVFLFFALFALAFYGYQFFTPTAIGQSVGTTLSAPTGVIASDGSYSDKVGVSLGHGARRDGLPRFSQHDE